MIGSPGKCVPLRQDTWLRAWSSRPSAQPPFPKAQPHSSAFCLCVFYKLFILTALGFCCCMWALGVVIGGYSILRGPSVSWWRLLLPCGLSSWGMWPSLSYGICGIFPDQGWNLCPLLWQVDS